MWSGEEGRAHGQAPFLPASQPHVLGRCGAHRIFVLQNPIGLGNCSVVPSSVFCLISNYYSGIWLTGASWDMSPLRSTLGAEKEPGILGAPGEVQAWAAPSRSKRHPRCHLGVEWVIGCQLGGSQSRGWGQPGGGSVGQCSFLGGLGGACPSSCHGGGQTDDRRQVGSAAPSKDPSPSWRVAPLEAVGGGVLLPPSTREWGGPLAASLARVLPAPLPTQLLPWRVAHTASGCTDSNGGTVGGPSWGSWRVCS